MNVETLKKNRWLVPVGAVLIQLALGAIYAWSAFTAKLEAAGGDYGFSATQTMWIFSLGLATFAVVMVLVGPWAKKNPRKAAVLSALVLGAGYVLGGFIGSSFWPMLICIGLIGGAGIGIGYVVPIAVGVKWYPDKKGLIAGLGVAGFGFGATLWVKMAGSWFMEGGLLSLSWFGLPGVQTVFILYGVVFTILVLIGSVWMVDPPEGWTPEGWTPPEPSNGAVAGQINFTTRQMLKTPQFYMIWLTFCLSALAGLMVIGCIKLFGIDALQESGAAASATIAGATAGTAMAWYAILNGLGRIVWGTVSDKIGRKMAIFLMCLIQGLIMLAFFHLGGSNAGLIAGACIIGFNFGGNFSLFPTATADNFGSKNLGPNYGWVFLSYGVAGIVGPQIAGHYKDAAPGDVKAWLAPFIIAGVGCLIAAVVALLVKPPKAPVDATPEEMAVAAETVPAEEKITEEAREAAKDEEKGE